MVHPQYHSLSHLREHLQYFFLYPKGAEHSPCPRTSLQSHQQQERMWWGRMCASTVLELFCSDFSHGSSGSLQVDLGQLFLLGEAHTCPSVSHNIRGHQGLQSCGDCNAPSHQPVLNLRTSFLFNVKVIYQLWVCWDSCLYFPILHCRHFYHWLWICLETAVMYCGFWFPLSGILFAIAYLVTKWLKGVLWFWWVLVAIPANNYVPTLGGLTHPCCRLLRHLVL